MECVAEHPDQAALITVNAGGLRQGRTFPIRPVPAYDNATLAVTGLLIVAAAAAVRVVGVALSWPTRAAVGLVVIAAVWRAVSRTARHLQCRLVESIGTDTATALLTPTTTTDISRETP